MTLAKSATDWKRGALASLNVQASDTSVQVDITSLVAAWQASPSTAFGLALKDTGQARVVFDTRETGNGAFIEIDWQSRKRPWSDLDHWKIGGPPGTRTPDQEIKSLLLYQLS